MRLLKYLVYFLMVCVALIGGGLVYIANYVNPNDYKPQIAEQAALKTGRTLVINGNISWSFFPSIGVVVRDVQLSNAAGFGAQPFAKIQEATIQVKVLPLLHKQIEVSALKLKNLELNLAKNSKGITNWQDIKEHGNKRASSQTAATPDDTATSTAVDNQKPNQAFAFSISDLDISNARIAWDDQQKGEKTTLRNVELHSQNTQLNKPFPLSLSITADANQMTTQLDLISQMTIKPKSNIYSFQTLKITAKTKDLNATLSADIAVNTDAQTIAVSKLNTIIGNLTATGNIQVSQFMTAPAIRGNIQIPAFDLRQFLQSIGQKPPATYDPAVLKTASASFNFNTTPNSLKLDNLKAHVDDTQLTGNLVINDFKNKNITLQAHVDRIQLDRYMESKEKPAKLMLTNIQLSGTGSPQKSNGRLQIAAVQAGELRLNSVDTYINVNNDNITLNPMTAQFYQGRYTGNINLDMRTPVMRLSSRQTLTNVQLEPLLNDLKALTHIKVSGLANIDTQLTAVGKNTDAMTRSLNGQIKLAINQGILYGIDIDHSVTAFVETTQTLLRNVRGSPLDLFNTVIGKVDPALKGGTGQTRFNNVTGTIGITNGVAHNNDLLLKTPTTTVTGAGTADLVNKKIDYRLNAAKLNPQDNQPYKYSVPIMITGSFANPSISLDPSIVNQIIKNEVANAAKKQLTDVVKQEAAKHLGDQLGDKIGEQLKNLDLNKLFR